MKFSDREKAFEDLFAHDAELLFKVRARRNKQAGMWVAKKLGISGDLAHALADSYVMGMYNKAGVLAAVRKTFAEHKFQIDEKELHAELDKFIVNARQHFMENKNESSSSI